MSLRSMIALAALCVASIGGAQYQGTTPVVDKKPAYKKTIGPKAKPINTRSFSPQVKEVTGQTPPQEVENVFDYLVYNTTEANTIQLGGLTKTQSPVDPKSNFPAIGATGWVPPDPDLAVGPNYIVATVNVAIAFFTKSGTKVFQQDLGANGFFSGMDVGSFVFDPKCFYDTASQRYYVVALEQADSPTTSKVLLAVSDDSDPNGTWFRYRIEAKQTINSVDYWLDYPGFGCNKDAVLVTGNMFGFTGGFNGIQYILINKPELLTGAAPVINYYSLQGGSVQVMRSPDNSLDTLYAVNWTGTSTAMIHAFTGITTTPVLSTVAVPIPTFTRPTAAVQSTGGHQLDPLDGRMLNCYVRSGRLYSAHTVRFSSDGTNGSRWYEFNLNNWPNTQGKSGANAPGDPTLRQAGTVGIGSGTHYWMPAIAANSTGDVALVFSRASASICADFMVSSRRSTDPAGFMNTPVRLATSIGSVYGGGGTNRWGDYFGCTVDPTDDKTFWGICMIANSTGGWQTVINSFKTSNPFSAAPTSVAMYEGVSSSGSLANILNSDNLYFKVNSKAISRTGQVASAIATFTVGQANISKLSVTLETAAAPYVTGSLFVWDWTTSKWVYVGAKPQSKADLVWSLGLSAPFSNYINSSTKQVKVLVRAIMPYTTIRPAVPYQFNIDQLKIDGTN